MANKMCFIIIVACFIMFWGYFEANCQTDTTRIRILYTTTIQTRDSLTLHGISEKLLITKANDLLDVAYRQHTQIKVAFSIAGYYKWNFNQYQSGWGWLSPCQIRDRLNDSIAPNVRGDETAADLVTSLINGNYVSGAMGCADPPGLPPNGFHSTADWKQVWYPYWGRSFQHEIGHNLGCLENSGWCDPINHFRTIMTYSSDCNGDSSITYFCAPPSSGVLYNGLPVGDSAHNNRQVIINQMPATALNRSPLSTVNLTNRVLTKGECLDVEATSQITTGVSVSASDTNAILSLRCTGPITLNSGLTIQNNAQFFVNSGISALLPKKKEKWQKPEMYNPSIAAAVIPSNRIYMHQNILNIEVFLSEEALVTYRIMDISGAVLEEKNIGKLENGRYQFYSKLSTPRLCIVELKVGRKVTYTRISPFCR